MRDLWDTRIKCSMAALEEVVFETLFEDRVVLLGDAAHKACHFRGIDSDYCKS
jgi:2-polyprenyl-6-methoxyphenol hydroxylase-like FAD-dependent oxidoreductase